MKKLVYITDAYITYVQKVKLQNMVKELRCFTIDYNCTGKHFLQGFLSTETELASAGIQVMPDTDEVLGEKVERSFSVIVRTTFDAQKEAFNPSRENLKQAIVLENEQICSCYEYAFDKLIVSTRGTHFLFDGMFQVAQFSDNSANKFFKNASDFPMGYFWPMPNFDVDRFPFLVTCGD